MLTFGPQAARPDGHGLFGTPLLSEIIGKHLHLSLPVACDLAHFITLTLPLVVSANFSYSSRTVSRIDDFWHFLHQITLNLHNFFTQPRGSDYLSTIQFIQENSKLFSYSKPN